MLEVPSQQQERRKYGIKQNTPSKWDTRFWEYKKPDGTAKSSIGFQQTGILIS
jgi:hypothetical protein